VLARSTTLFFEGRGEEETWVPSRGVRRLGRGEVSFGSTVSVAVEGGRQELVSSGSCGGKHSGFVLSRRSLSASFLSPPLFFVDSRDKGGRRRIYANRGGMT